MGDTVASTCPGEGQPANEIGGDFYKTGEETGETEGDEALVFTGKVDPDTLEESTQPVLTRRGVPLGQEALQAHQLG